MLSAEGNGCRYVLANFMAAVEYLKSQDLESRVAASCPVFDLPVLFPSSSMRHTPLLMARVCMVVCIGSRNPLC